MNILRAFHEVQTGPQRGVSHGKAGMLQAEKGQIASESRLVEEMVT
jgi:hypothetical protein